MAREMKNSGVKWLGEIPRNWEISKLKYHVQISSGDAFLSEYEADEDAFPLYGGGEQMGYSSKSNAKKGCLIVGRVGSCGSVNCPEKDFWATDNALVIKPSLPLKFSYYLLTAANLKTLSTSNAQPLITSSKIKNVSIPLPPCSEQKAIADFLDSKCEDIDRLLVDLDQEVKTLVDYKKSLISESVTHGLNPSAPVKQVSLGWIEAVPEHWMLEKGKYAFALRRTKGNLHNLELLSPSQKYGVIPQSQLEGVVLVDEKTNLETFRTIHKGDFCISLRSFQGGFEYSIYEGVVSPAYQVFYPTINVCVGYFKYLFKSDGFISKINTFSMSLRDGKNIAFDDFGNMYLPIPPIEEQKAIAAFLDNKLKAIQETITAKQDQIEKLKAYKASLIYEYVTGKKQVAL